MSRWTYGLVAFLFAIGMYLFFWPVSVDPVAWKSPSPTKLSGPYEANQKLRGAKTLATDIGKGPEDVTFDTAGFLYTGFEDGRIIRMNPRTHKWNVYVNTGGRPLGLVMTDTGTLYVTDAKKGLLRISKDRSVTVLTDSASGQSFGFTNNVDVASDGRVYFTDASSKFGYNQTKKDVIEHRSHGRLMRYNPETKKTRVLMNDLYFANGIALSKNEKFLLVCDMNNYRILRYWLEGPKAGSHDVFVDRLPGFPDNIKRDENGHFWVGIPVLRNYWIDTFSQYPLLRKILARLPSIMQPAPTRHGLVLALDESGQVIHNLQDSTGDVAFVAGPVKYKSKLYLGSYREPYLRVHELSASLVN